MAKHDIETAVAHLISWAAVPRRTASTYSLSDLCAAMRVPAPTNAVARRTAIHVIKASGRFVRVPLPGAPSVMVWRVARPGEVVPAPTLAKRVPRPPPSESELGSLERARQLSIGLDDRVRAELADRPIVLASELVSSGLLSPRLAHATGAALRRLGYEDRRVSLDGRQVRVWTRTDATPAPVSMSASTSAPDPTEPRWHDPRPTSPGQPDRRRVRMLAPFTADDRVFFAGREAEALTAASLLPEVTVEGIVRVLGLPEERERAVAQVLTRAGYRPRFHPAWSPRHGFAPYVVVPWTPPGVVDPPRPRVNPRSRSRG